MPTIGVAVTIPAPHGAHLQDCRERFGDPMAEFIPAHVTLLPPTEVADEQRAGFEAHLTSVARAHAPFTMTLSGTGTFRPVSPVVFVQVSQGISECERLETGVRGGPVRRDLEFPYHPHVTVAHHLGEEALDAAFEGLADYRVSFEVGTIDLYEHGSDGVWRISRRFGLGGESR